MNILFVGPYRQNDGWGNATRDYIRALSTNTTNSITAQPIYLSSHDANFSDEQILSLEKSRYENYDVVIQQTLPECFSVNRTFKQNIGITMLETNNYKDSSIIQSINRLDELWVPSSQEKNTLQKSGVKIPIKIISQPIDTQYITSLSDYKLKLNPILDNFFKFYFIGEYNYRKNLYDLITAFHLAFSYEERVCLIIKTAIPGSKPQQSRQKIEQEIDNFKKTLNISNKYKKEILITENLTYKDVIGLHNVCDCFVMPSYGESFCRPAAEALLCGKTPIVNSNTGMTDFINTDNGFLIKNHATPVICSPRPLSSSFDMYTSNEHWYKPDIYDLVDKLRTVYENKNSQQIKDKQEAGRKSVDQFSYSEIGKKLCI